jgi:hypothetical protein
VKFSTFVKLGGHAFNLLQNKDLMELYGIVKPGIQGQMQKMKETPSPPAGNAPTHFPVPIDSPYLHPYQLPQQPVNRVPFYGYSHLPPYPPYRKK